MSFMCLNAAYLVRINRRCQNNSFASPTCTIHAIAVNKEQFHKNVRLTYRTLENNHGKFRYKIQNRRGFRPGCFSRSLHVCARKVEKQGVALTGRNRTVPSCSVGRRTSHAPCPAAADRPRALQTMTDDRRQTTPTDDSVQNNTGQLSPVHTSNNVEATLSKQQATLLPVASTMLPFWATMSKHRSTLSKQHSTL